MRIGTLRHRVEVQRSVQSQSGSGASTPTWGHLYYAWAKVSPAVGAKALVGGELDAPQKVLVRIRYRADLRTDCRILFEGTVYEIESISDYDERKIFQDMVCTVWQADGFRGEK